MPSKKSAPKNAPATIPPATGPRHPTNWHGEVALGLRRLYAHRIDDPERRTSLETVIGIPWSEWAALSRERSENVNHQRLMASGGKLPQGSEPVDGQLYTSESQTGVDYKGKAYDDAIPVYARGDLPSGTIWFWFYPKG